MRVGGIVVFFPILDFPQHHFTGNGKNIEAGVVENIPAVWHAQHRGLEPERFLFSRLNMAASGPCHGFGVMHHGGCHTE
ncbi:MAG: hypothetical protein COA53_10700 [Rhodobacteraceae bacterium]|nr:MAG: hypothetical protein COA53_10700 [Paracoccaceae bacterium]